MGVRTEGEVSDVGGPGDNGGDISPSLTLTPFPRVALDKGTGQGEGHNYVPGGLRRLPFYDLLGKVPQVVWDWKDP